MARFLLGPDEEAILERLAERSSVCATELSSYLGSDSAWILIDAAVCEAFGWLLDRSSPPARSSPPMDPEGAGNPSRSELLDFFHRFWWMAEMTLEKGVGDYAGLEIERLREVQGTLCASLVRQYPTTVGRFGRETLARDWRAIVQELPQIWEAHTRLESSPEGALACSGFTADLREILRPLEARALGLEPLFRLRTLARERLQKTRSQVKRSRGR